MEYTCQELKEKDARLVAEVLQKDLSINFKDASVKIVECPDLRQSPFHLASEGICGNTRIADIGGPPYLVPLVQKDKVYNLEEIAKTIGLPNAFMIGAGAGPCHHVGVNSEMMPNIKVTDNKIVNNTHIAKVNPENNSYTLEKLDACRDMCLLANLFASNGHAGQVLEVKAKQRIGPKNFVSCMREALGAHFEDDPVGIGGVFLVKKGKAKLHVMPDFSPVALKTDDDVNNWLNFYEMSSPLICLSVFVSHDPGLDLRVEHTHCFSRHGDGGHYHYDTTPDEVEYHGYFNLAEKLFRIDRPENSHHIGQSEFHCVHNGPDLHPTTNLRKILGVRPEGLHLFRRPREGVRPGASEFYKVTSRGNENLPTRAKARCAMLCSQKANCTGFSLSVQNNCQLEVEDPSSLPNFHDGYVAKAYLKPTTFPAMPSTTETYTTLASLQSTPGNEDCQTMEFGSTSNFTLTWNFPTVEQMSNLSLGMYLCPNSSSWIKDNRCAVVIEQENQLSFDSAVNICQIIGGSSSSALNYQDFDNLYRITQKENIDKVWIVGNECRYYDASVVELSVESCSATVKAFLCSVPATSLCTSPYSSKDKCFLLIEKKMTFKNTQLVCKALGSHLPMLPSREMKDLAIQSIPSGPAALIHLGVFYSEMWIDEDGVPVEQSPDLPNPPPGANSTLLLDKDGTILVNSLASKAYPLCLFRNKGKVLSTVYLNGTEVTNGVQEDKLAETKTQNKFRLWRRGIPEADSASFTFFKAKLRPNRSFMGKACLSIHRIFSEK